MKKLLILLLICLLSLTLVALGYAETTEDEPVEYTSGDYAYTLDADGNATITDYDGEEETVVVPDTLDGHPVTAIGDSVLYSDSTITSVQLPDSLLSIGQYVFNNCSSLTAITVSADHPVFVSQDGVLFEKENSALLVYPAGKSDAQYSIPEGTQSIENYAFYGCDSLTSITLPDGLLTIGEQAFYGCDELTSISLPDSLLVVGDAAFSNCDALASITVSADNPVFTVIDGALIDQESQTFIAYPAAKTDETYNVPDGILSIADGAFYSCSALVSITLPDSLLSIGKSAFSFCASLETITLPENVQYIGDTPFYDCSSLTSIQVAPDNLVYASINGVLFEKQSKALLAYPVGRTDTTYSVPDGILSLANYAFFDSDFLISIVLPDSVISVGEFAFGLCMELTSIVLSEDLQTIGDNAFFCCTSLETITLPKNVESIDSTLFFYCGSLVSIEVSPDNAVYTSIDGVLYNMQNKALIIYPMGKENTTYSVPDGIEIIGSYAFYYCNDLTSISLPDSLVSIEEHAFSLCGSLASINLPDCLVSIGADAFYGCDEIVSITLPETLEFIGEDAFASCDALTLTVVRDSYGHQYAVDQGITFQYTDALDWLNN